MERLYFPVLHAYIRQMHIDFLSWISIVSAVIFGNAAWFGFLWGLKKLQEAEDAKEDPPWAVILIGLGSCFTAGFGLYLTQ